MFGLFYLHHTKKSHLLSYLLFMIVTGEFEVIAHSCTILQKCGAPEKCSFVDVGKYETIKAELAKIFHISNAYSKNKEDET